MKIVVLFSSELMQFALYVSGGYYTELIKPGMRLIGLNTNLYFVLNELVRGNEDPAGQFAWLDQTLTLAKNRVEKVSKTGPCCPRLITKQNVHTQNTCTVVYTNIPLSYTNVKMKYVGKK